MNKNKLKNFALWAREELTFRVSVRYEKQKSRIAELSGDGKKGQTGESDIEQAAYLWFHRLIAIRYMEANGYLPGEETGVLETLCEMEEPDRARDQLLLLCNRLGSALPQLFPLINEKMEMLLPKEIFSRESAVPRLLEEISPEEWRGGVEIVGWLHQYYHAEQKKTVSGDFQKQNVKISKERIPAVTQLFTPDWIVRYLVENSLGRLWRSRCPQAEELKKTWRYYCEAEEQKEPFPERWDPRKIKLMDPCMGSGHILLYAFELFMQMYQAEGYDRAEAARLILQHNLFGLDIDPRACQLACFTIMMKARQYDPHILEEQRKPQVYVVEDSRFLTAPLIEFIAGTDLEMKCDLMTLAEDFYDAEEYGSLVQARPVDLERLTARALEICGTFYKEVVSALYAQQVREKLLPLLAQAEVMTRTYDVVVTNPPYMGKSAMDQKLRDYVRKNFPLSNYDLYAVFIEKCDQMTKEEGYQAMITQQSWMFLRSYEQLRRRIFQARTVVHMIHLGTRAFEEISGEVVQTVAWIMKKTELRKGQGVYMRLTEFGSGKEQAFLEEKEQGLHGVTYRADSSSFFRIPGGPAAYWLPGEACGLFERTRTSEFAVVKNGMFTCDNRRFLRLWYELPKDRIAFGCTSRYDCEKTGKKWFPYNKGGNFRRWYGNQEYVIDFEQFGEEIRRYRISSGQSAVFPGQDYYFQESLSWSLVSPGRFGIRYYPPGFVFDIAGSSLFPIRQEHLYPMLGVLASSPVYRLLQALNPTVNYQAGDVRSIPMLEECLSGETAETLERLVRDNIRIAAKDWNSRETSWDFERHPLVAQAAELRRRQDAGLSVSLADCYAALELWEETQKKRLVENENEINRIVGKLYGLPWEDPSGRDQASYLRKITFSGQMRELFSYCVGCMLGRFEDGCQKTPQGFLVLEEDQVLPGLEQCLTDWFGPETLEENLLILAGGLEGEKPVPDPGKEAIPEEKVREARKRLMDYIRKDFFEEHSRTYQKRPVYWLVESGRQKGFCALLYAHRYRPEDLKLLSEQAAAARKKKERGEKKGLEELSRFLPVLDALAGEAPVLDPDDGILANRRKLSAILKM